MRRATTALVLALAAFAATAPTAGAHPLGNFTINHLEQMRISSDRVAVHYILDQAEIPTFQERDLSPAQVLLRKRAEVARGLRLTVDGRAVPLALAQGGRISFPAGQGGLKLTRIELDLSAPVRAPHAVVLRDGSFSGRVGWREMIVSSGHGTAVRSSVPATDPTGGLRNYPQDLLKSPLDQRSASFTVKPGSGSITAPDARGAPATSGGHPSGDGFASVFSDASSGKGVLLLLLLAAFGWGALHALSPGHGKALVAGYLVGTRGTARHAAALGATVTITHTLGVFALGFVTLALSQYILPEQLYPWLTLASGLLVVIIGLGVLRSRVRHVRASRAHSHSPDHAHTHDHGHAHDHDGSHGHSHVPPNEITWRGLIGMGASAGLIPCPSALVVLLGAISQHRVGLGLLLITAFSLGLAGTMTGLGLTVVYARRLTSRLNFSSRVVTALPAVSALIIVGVGCVLTANAVAHVVG